MPLRSIFRLAISSFLVFQTIACMLSKAYFAVSRLSMSLNYWMALSIFSIFGCYNFALKPDSRPYCPEMSKISWHTVTKKPSLFISSTSKHWTTKSQIAGRCPLKFYFSSPLPLSSTPMIMVVYCSSISSRSSRKKSRLSGSSWNCSRLRVHI